MESRRKACGNMHLKEALDIEFSGLGLRPLLYRQHRPHHTVRRGWNRATGNASHQTPNDLRTVIESTWMKSADHAIFDSVRHCRLRVHLRGRGNVDPGCSSRALSGVGLASRAHWWAAYHWPFSKKHMLTRLLRGHSDQWPRSHRHRQPGRVPEQHHSGRPESGVPPAHQQAIRPSRPFGPCG